MNNAHTAIAHPNIALVKYWGKRDDRLIIPATPSLSLTLDVFPTTTTVTTDTHLAVDEVTLNSQPAAAVVKARIVAFLDLVRELVHTDTKAVVNTANTVPTGAGLASSAAGFAALAVAAASAYGLELTQHDLSRLARRGSGSASRSIFPDFAVWHAGYDDESSYAEHIPDAKVDVAMVIAIVSAKEKAVSSRSAMRHTVATSPFFDAWMDASVADLGEMLGALSDGDLTAVGTITERNALRMHATMMSADPAVRYLNGDSMRVLDVVQDLRMSGVGAWATMDAGPNVKVLCAAADLPVVTAAISECVGDDQVVIARPGPGAALQPVQPAVTGLDASA